MKSVINTVSRLHSQRAAVTEAVSRDFSASGRSLSFEQMSELIGAVYQGPIEAVPWGATLVLLRRHLRANSATVILRRASPAHPALLIRDVGRGPEFDRSPYNHYEVFSMDPFVGLPPDRVVTIDEMIDTGKWMQGEFYKSFIEPIDVRYILGADIVAADGADCRLRVTRSPNEENFSDWDKALCQALLPHLQRAVNLHSHIEEIETERQLYSTTMDRMLVGTVVLNDKGAVMRTNSVADAILTERDGLRVSQGALHADFPAEDRVLQRLVKVALSSSAALPAVPEAMTVTRRAGRAGLGVLVRPIPLRERFERRSQPSAVAFIRDPQRRSHPPQELIRKLFGLTASEATLALLLADGLTLDEAAEQLGIRKNTSRAHLRSIFAKTGVRRQTTLVHLLLNSVASIS